MRRPRTPSAPPPRPQSATQPRPPTSSPPPPPRHTSTTRPRRAAQAALRAEMDAMRAALVSAEAELAASRRADRDSMHGSGAALSDGDGGALHAALYLASRRSEEERTSTNPARARGARRLSIIGRMRRSSITTTAAPGEASSGRRSSVELAGQALSGLVNAHSAVGVGMRRRLSTIFNTATPSTSKVAPDCTPSSGPSYDPVVSLDYRLDESRRDITQCGIGTRSVMSG